LNVAKYDTALSKAVIQELKFGLNCEAILSLIIDAIFMTLVTNSVAAK